MSKEKKPEEVKAWSEDISQLWVNEGWKRYLPWEEKESTKERSNSTARLIIYLAGISYLLRRNIKFIKYGVGGLFALYLLEGRGEKKEENQEPEEKPEPEGSVFDAEGVNFRVNTVPDVSEILPKVKRAREKNFRIPRVPTKAEQAYGSRNARKSHAKMKDSIYEPNRAGSERYQSRRGDFST